MPDPKTFESRLADAFRRYAGRVTSDVDAEALAREIATASARGANRLPRWWPFGGNDQGKGRSRSMFSATRIAAVIAVVMLGSGLALSGLVSDPGDEAVGPPGAEAPLVGDDWAFFSGTRDGGSPSASALRRRENGMDVRLGESWTNQPLETDDARMTGTITTTDNSFTVAGGTPMLADGTGGAIWNQIYVIKNEGGTWTCEMPAIEVGDVLSENGWCTGAGDYEGLRAYMVIVGFTEVAGYITSGDGPPLPEAASAG